MKTIALVIPVFNEGNAIDKHLPVIFEQLQLIKHIQWQVIVVDDGSTDQTIEMLYQLSYTYPYLNVISLNRHFGKEAAIYAGLQSMDGAAAAIVMDSDLQHPPHLIAKMVHLWQQGIEVVEGYKIDRGPESYLSRFLADNFYRLFNLFAGLNLKNHSDFKLLDKKVIETYCALPEKKRFFRGLIHWLGFTTAQLPFEVPKRQHGATTWSRLKLVQFSFSTLTTFSSRPLQIITFLGLLSFLIGLMIGGIALYHKFSGNAVSGFATVILLILIMNSLLMLALGIIGIYIAHIYDELKQRPNYLIHWEKSRLSQNLRNGQEAPTACSSLQSITRQNKQ